MQISISTDDKIPSGYRAYKNKPPYKKVHMNRFSHFCKSKSMWSKTTWSAKLLQSKFAVALETVCDHLISQS